MVSECRVADEERDLQQRCGQDGSEEGHWGVPSRPIHPYQLICELAAISISTQSSPEAVEARHFLRKLTVTGTYELRTFDVDREGDHRTRIRSA